MERQKCPYCGLEVGIENDKLAWHGNAMGFDCMGVGKWSRKTVDERMAAKALPKGSEASNMEAPLSPMKTLRGNAAFLRHYLENYVVSVPVMDNKGHIANRFAAVQIPDWALKQRLQEIDEAIAAEDARLKEDSCSTE